MVFTLFEMERKIKVIPIQFYFLFVERFGSIAHGGTRRSRGSR